MRLADNNGINVSFINEVSNPRDACVAFCFFKRECDGAAVIRHGYTDCFAADINAKVLHTYYNTTAEAARAVWTGGVLFVVVWVGGMGGGRCKRGGGSDGWRVIRRCLGGRYGTDGHCATRRSDQE